MSQTGAPISTTVKPFSGEAMNHGTRLAIRAYLGPSAQLRMPAAGVGVVVMRAVELRQRKGLAGATSQAIIPPSQSKAIIVKFIKGVLYTYVSMILCLVVFYFVPFENFHMMLYHQSWAILLLVIDSRDPLALFQGTWGPEVVMGDNNNTSSYCMTCSNFYHI